MMLLYSLALATTLALSAPVWLTRMLRQGRYREGLGQRLGRVPPAVRAFAAGRPVLWLHAVSVGEVLAATALVRQLELALPGHAIVISTTTPTGQRVAREHFAPEATDGALHPSRVFFFPLDFAFAVRAYLRALRPRMVILMESELWPRMLMECDRAKVPVAVVNARVSDRSLPRYLRLRALWRPLLAKVSLLLAQSGEDARRWIAIGAPAGRVRNAGNLKYDSAATPSALAGTIRLYLPDGAKVLAGGSTHDGEEALLLDCFQSLSASLSAPVLLLAPRHPQRCEAVAMLIAQRGLRCLRLSAWIDEPAAIPRGAVLLVDTVGQLASLYSLGSVAFVGGSLVPAGGHNPLEPAQFGLAVVVGPHFENFRVMVQAMLAAGAIQIANADSLCATLAAMLAGNSPMGERARTFARTEQGAVARTVDALLPLLMERRP